MIQKSGIYVRAKDPTGRWGSVLVEDLTLESFKVFVVRHLHKFGVLVGMTDEVNAPYEFRTDKHLIGETDE